MKYLADVQLQLFHIRANMSYPRTLANSQTDAAHPRHTGPSKSHEHLQGRGFCTHCGTPCNNGNSGCAQGASCSAQLMFVHRCSAGEQCVQATPHTAVENSFSENEFPHYCVSSFSSHLALISGLKGTWGLHFGGLSRAILKNIIRKNKEVFLPPPAEENRSTAENRLE